MHRDYDRGRGAAISRCSRRCAGVRLCRTRPRCTSTQSTTYYRSVSREAATRRRLILAGVPLRRASDHRCDQPERSAESLCIDGPCTARGHDCPVFRPSLCNAITPGPRTSVSPGKSAGCVNQRDVGVKGRIARRPRSPHRLVRRPRPRSPPHSAPSMSTVPASDSPPFRMSTPGAECVVVRTRRVWAALS